MSTETTVLVAPRPLRISAFASRTPQRIVNNNINNITNGSAPSSDDTDAPSPSASPRTSPRLSLPADALEEFLSILRPSFFSPTSSSPFRPRRHGSASIPPSSFPCDLSLHSKSPSYGTLDPDDADSSRKRFETPSPATAESADQFSPTARTWRIPGILESPISRTNTRNPFQRHPSYEVAISSVLTNHLSPALLPLPPSPPASAQPSDTPEKEDPTA